MVSFGQASRVLGLALLATGFVLGACLGPPAHLVVTVEDPEGVAVDVVKLAAGTSLESLSETRPDRLGFPLVVTVQASAAGERTLWVEARDATGRALGRGRTTARFATAGFPTAIVRLSKACGIDDDCADASFCNGVESCSDWRCNAAPASACGSHVACITSTCVELGGGAGVCDISAEHAMCAAGEYCNPVAGCLPGEPCLEDLDCQDDSVCNGPERCVAFSCQPGTTPGRDDADSCTVDGCNEELGVFHVPLATLDGNTCVKAGGARELCLAAAGGCVVSSCGDGFVDGGLQPPELCDDGQENASSWSHERRCTTVCDGFAPHCGDGEVNSPEACDDGNRRSDGNDCSAECGCEGIACATLDWRAIGGSEYAPRETYVTWGSGACPGFGGVLYGGSAYIRWLTDASGGLHLKHVQGAASADRRIRDWRWTGTTLQEGASIPDVGTYSVWSESEAENPVIAWTAGGEVMVARWSGEAWVEVGAGSMSASGVSNSGGKAQGVQLAYGDAGNIVVVWHQAVATLEGNLYVRRFDGAAWVELAGSGTGTGITGSGTARAFGNDVVLDATGNPVIAYSNKVSSTNYELYLKRWDGATWSALGGSASGGGISNNTRIDGDSALRVLGGEIYVAWSTFPSGGQADIYVKKWNGTSWVELGTGSASGNGISEAATSDSALGLALDEAGRPVVSWVASTPYTLGSKRYLHVRRFDGGAWQQLGAGSAQGPGLFEEGVGGASVFVDAQGLVHLAWTKSSIPRAMYFDGGAWRSYVEASSDGTTALATRGDSSEPVVVLDALGRPLVAWTDEFEGRNKIYVMRHDGTAWVEVGTGSASGNGLGTPTGTSQRPALVLDGLGRPVVAWQEKNAGVYVKRWNGAAWEELGAGSASGGGVSQSSDWAGSPALAARGDEEIFLTWIDQGWNWNGDVYLKLWTGTAWQELGAGSGSQGGVTRGQGLLWDDHVSIAVDGQGRPALVWQNGGSGEVCALRWDGAAWAELGPGSGDEGFSYTGGESKRPVVQVASDGAVYVAFWDDFLYEGSLYVWAFDGLAWRLLPGEGSASGSLGPASELAPAMRLDELGRPFVAWQSTTADGSEVAMLRWNRDRWVEVGAGSASGGGLSNAVCDSMAPSLALRDGTACVAWSESGLASRDIVVRCTSW